MSPLLGYIHRPFTADVLQGSPRAQANQFQDNLGRGTTMSGLVHWGV